MIKEKLCPVDEFYIWLEEDIERVAAEALLPRKVKRGRKPTKKIYFDYRNEAAIVAFNKETIQSKRDKIYREHINAAFSSRILK